MTSVRSNILATQAQNHLARNHNRLSTAVERLASGLRINSAKDDTAGMAIANRMQSQRSGLEQAGRNANDGISMSQTAQGALGEINERLQRIRVLAVQGLNELNNGDAGDKIQAEINLNLKEIDRLNRAASFNGMALLDGSAGTRNLQVGAHDGETLSVDLNPPGFSVQELGLLDLTIQGRPDTITPVDEVTGSASMIPLDDPATSVAYLPPDNSPNLVDVQRPGSRDVIQLDGPGGRLKEVSISAHHDTDTLQSNVSIQVRDAVVYTTVAEWMSTRSYQDENGDLFALTNPSVVRSGGQYWIEHSHNGSLHYFEAEVTVHGGENSLTARAKTDTRVATADLPGPTATLNYAPYVSKATADYSLTLDGADAASDANLDLVYLGGYYYVEESLGGGQYQYHYADVDITTGGAQDAITVTSSRATQLSVVDDPYVSGTSTVHLEPANGNVQVNYVEANGQTHTDVMRPDAEGGYRFNIHESANGADAYKTAKVVRNQDGEYRLQTINGSGEVVLYYPMNAWVSTNVENNQTIITLGEAGDAERLRHPALPLAAIDAAIARVDDKRSELGALDNRLESLISGNGQTAMNIAAAQSRIGDTNYAEEVSQLTRSQIVQQAGTAMLAQANQLPQGVMTLLG